MAEGVRIGDKTSVSVPTTGDKLLLGRSAGDKTITVDDFIVDDLTTGGSLNALSAEQGKTLKSLIDNSSSGGGITYQIDGDFNNVDAGTYPTSTNNVYVSNLTRTVRNTGTFDIVSSTVAGKNNALSITGIGTSGEGFIETLHRDVFSNRDVFTRKV